MAVAALLALDRETLIQQVDDLLMHVRHLYVGVGPEGQDTVVGRASLIDDLDQLALDLRTLPIAGSER